MAESAVEPPVNETRPPRSEERTNNQNAAANPNGANRDDMWQNVQNVANDSEEEEIELKYGAEHVIKLFIPVSLCMVIVVATISSITFYSTSDVYFLYTPFHETSDQFLDKFQDAFLNAMILLCVVVTLTIVLIILYKKRCYMIIKGWLGLSSILLLSLFTVFYLAEFLRVYNIGMDWISLVLIVWNYLFVGMVCIHWCGPLRLQQAYLIFMASLMSLIFIKYFPDFTLWVVLAVISIWDLVAVLCPKGPLRILVETAQERNEPIFPALIYSSNVIYTSIDTNEVMAPARCNTRRLNTLPNAKPAIARPAIARPSPDSVNESDSSLLAPSTSQSSHSGSEEVLSSTSPPSSGMTKFKVDMSYQEPEVFDNVTPGDFKNKYQVFPEEYLPPMVNHSLEYAGQDDVLSEECSGQEEVLSDIDGDESFPREYSLDVHVDGEVDTSPDEPTRGVARGGDDNEAPNLKRRRGSKDKATENGTTGEEGFTQDWEQGREQRERVRRERISAHMAANPADVTREIGNNDRQMAAMEEEEHGVKLGLGDFIFYSVLVGKASSYGDWNTTFACFVAILIGLCLTLIMLAIFKKALPALPISIAFGLFFYFCTSFIVVPFTELLTIEQVFI